MVRVYWPILDVIKLLGPRFVEEFNHKRINQKITLKTIWPRTQTPPQKKFPFLQAGIESKREVRLAPEGVDFSLGYTIYGNTVRFISSSKESFGFLITSREFAQTMITNFDIIWDSLK
ncbi:MAG: hypothetical protein HY397_03630 [Candidatus Doudnabacteria bacterium]|nr:hypothetical protein [Candidatus Doudnabacteria bacterium]